ncbi:MAG: phytanoyl-CoA dioxygenase family protein [Planctomycetaceae bacterium]
MLDSTAIAQLETDGYVVVRQLLDVSREIDPVIAEYEQLLDRLAGAWKQSGRIRTTCAGLPFSERLRRIVSEAELAYDLHFDISLPQADITPETPMHHGPAVFDLLRSRSLLDAVEQIVGPEIYSNPVQHTRIKLPERQLPDRSRTGLTAQIAWHQDQGVITEDADDSEILTVWFPITRATLDNGCLAVIPGSHCDALAVHCRSRDPLTQGQVCIPDALVAQRGVPLPMDPGDVLFMHRKTQHCGLPNRSDEVRWSFDLRYQPTGQPTGRRWFPGFVARSRARPETELNDAEKWAASWRSARCELARSSDVAFNRWKQGDPRCA